MAQTKTMDNLPDEIIEQIFSHMKPRDFLNARLVCWRWRRISNTLSLQERVITFIRNYRDMVAFYASSTEFAEQFRPVYIKLKILLNDIQSNADKENGNKFWQHRGKRLLGLYVFVEATHVPILLDILEKCPNLQELQLETNRKFNKDIFNISYSSVNFKKLLKLHLIGYHNFVIPIIKRAIEDAEFLKSIKISCYTCIESGFNGSSHTPLNTSFEYSKMLNVKSIYIKCSIIDDIFIDKLTTNLGNNLEYISLLYSENLTNLTLRYLAERCSSLQRLVIGNWYGDIFNYGELFLRLTKLTAIYIHFANINDEEVAILGVLLSLACLCISQCFSVTDEGICNIFDKKVRSTIIELRLLRLQITDRVMGEIAPLLPNLKILNLGHCVRITPVSIQAVADNNHLLKCFTITGRPLADAVRMRSFEEEITPCINSLTNLIHFTCYNNGHISTALSAILQLPHLRVLYCAIPSSAFADILLRNPSLKYINNFQCETETYTTDSALLYLRRRKILPECNESPFGNCNVV